MGEQTLKGNLKGGQLAHLPPLFCLLGRWPGRTAVAGAGGRHGSSEIHFPFQNIKYGSFILSRCTDFWQCSGTGARCSSGPRRSSLPVHCAGGAPANPGSRARPAPALPAVNTKNVARLAEAIHKVTTQ